MHANGKVCLVIIDGWGLSAAPAGEGDAIAQAKTPCMDQLMQTQTKSNHAETIQPMLTQDQMQASWVPLQAHGLAVGLPAGLMGNSEVGHLNIGAGRVVFQDIVRIDRAIETGAMARNPTLLSTLGSGAQRIHLVGLVSDGGVHSHLNHLRALLQICQEHVPMVYVHAITDGRDTAPRSATKYLQEIAGLGKLATVQGRYYAMDRDQRLERTQMAWQALTLGQGEALVHDHVVNHGKGNNASANDHGGSQGHTSEEGLAALMTAISERYDRDETDEFFTPMIVDPAGLIREGDAVILFNYRSDRMRQLGALFNAEQQAGRLRVCSMTQYKAEFDLPVLSPPQSMAGVLAEHLANLGKRQLHVAETEKYAHVTFFFNGGVEKNFAGEDRKLVASPKVATYDLQPAMSVAAVAEEVCAGLSSPSPSYDLVMCNLAPPDMVGHTGRLAETIQAVEATDAAIEKIRGACLKHGYTLLITADHGNAECMLDHQTGHPHTAHTCSPVPLILANSDRTLTSNPDAALCDVAPTILALMHLPQPPEMTGCSLLSPI